MLDGFLCGVLVLFGVLFVLPLAAYLCAKFATYGVLTAKFVFDLNHTKDEV